MEALREVTLLAVGLRILTAMICGGLIGMDRGLKKRAAGMRTYMLVCVGACIIMLTNQFIFQITGTGDPMRMGAQVVSGIGFLGAGTIIVTKQNHIKGLTTAAGLWAAAGVGLALGIGFYEAAVIGGLAIYLILTALNWLDHKVHNRNMYLDVHLTLSSDLSADKFILATKDAGIEIETIQIDYSNYADGIWMLDAVLKINKHQKRESMVEQLAKIEGIIHLEEI